jgi:hypothetical protein
MEFWPRRPAEKRVDGLARLARVRLGVPSHREGRVPFYNALTDMEYSYFTTKPEEVR